MDSFGDDQIRRLLRLKRYEQPPPGYFDNFLREFHRRQCERDELLHQSLWRTCVDSAESFALRFNPRPLASAGVAAVLVCGAVVSLRLIQQPNSTQVAVQRQPIPTVNIERQLDFPPSVFNATFDMQPTLRLRSRNRPAQPAHSLRSNQFVPLNLERELREEQSLLSENN